MGAGCTVGASGTSDLLFVLALLGFLKWVVLWQNKNFATACPLKAWSFAGRFFHRCYVHMVFQEGLLMNTSALTNT